MKRKIVAGNWKMNLGSAASKELALSLASLSLDPSVEVWVAPSFTSLEGVLAILENSPIKVGAQNAYWEQKGAFTGEVSAPMIKELGCTFSLVGHSERRQLFNEDSGMVSKRLQGVLNSDLIGVLCIGEQLDSREAGHTFKVLEEQLRPCLDAIKKSPKNCVIAYEPVWAIGTGKVASTAQIAETHEWISKFVQQEIGSAPPLLYGGSVTPENFSEIIAIPAVNGGLIGGASLQAEKFLSLITSARSS